MWLGIPVVGGRPMSSCGVAAHLSTGFLAPGRPLRAAPQGGVTGCFAGLVTLDDDPSDRRRQPVLCLPLESYRDLSVNRG